MHTRTLLYLATVLWLLAGPPPAEARVLPEERNSVSAAMQLQADCSGSLLRNRCDRTCGACLTAAAMQAKPLVDFAFHEVPSAPAPRFTNEALAPDIAPPRPGAA